MTLTYPSALILQAVVSGYRYGFEIMEATSLPSGTVYPALRRMEDAGLIRAQWESERIAQREQRPPRRYYEPTRQAAAALAEAVKKHRLLEHVLPHIKPQLRPAKA
jgi:DNA-binding PadR family transcriptional regulator